MAHRIPFNKPFLTGKELDYVTQAIAAGQLSGNGPFTRRCQELLEQRLAIARVILTPSCTAALEMAAMLLDLGPGDEVILPSFTFVSTAGAFVRVGAKPVFVDIRPDTLNLDERLIEAAITGRTRAIVPVHYAGVACAMDRIGAIARAHGLRVVEDAAQAVYAFDRGRALGTLGDLGAYSFHETKNYICGEGGALCINDPALVERAEILRDMGTNRAQFFRGQVDKYTWLDVGSSFVLGELPAAVLCAQLERLDEIRTRRGLAFEHYHRRLAPLEAEGRLRRPTIPPECETNYHMYYIILAMREIRDALMERLNGLGIGAVFHYVPLHSSPMGRTYGYREGDLPVTQDLSGRLLRLPFYTEISREEQDRVVEALADFLAPTALPRGCRESAETRTLPA